MRILLSGYSYTREYFSPLFFPAVYDATIVIAAAQLIAYVASIPPIYRNAMLDMTADAAIAMKASISFS